MNILDLIEKSMEIAWKVTRLAFIYHIKIDIEKLVEDFDGNYQKIMEELDKIDRFLKE